MLEKSDLGNKIAIKRIVTAIRHMKTIGPIFSLVVLLGFVGCADRAVEMRNTQEAAKAKVRAEAARKEMEAMPKAFTSPPFFQRNVSGDSPAPTPTPTPNL